MKLAKLSLAAIVVAGLTTSAFAADTLADAFKEGKISGELRAWYFDRDRNAAGESGDIFNTGVRLTYLSGSLHGFSLGATMQSSYSPFADVDAKNVFEDDMYGSGVQLSEAYINYTLGKTTAKVGRQFIKTPLIGSSASRMITQSFEGALVTNTNLPQTTVMAGVITKFQARTNGSERISESDEFGDVADFEALNNDHDYAYTAMIVNKSIPNLELTFQYLTLDNDASAVSTTTSSSASAKAKSKLANQTKGYQDFYLEADYQSTLGAFDYGIAVNYLYTNWQSYDEGIMYGAKVNIGYGDFKAYAAYSEIVSDESKKGVKSGEGGGAQPNFVKGKQIQVGKYSADTKGYSLDANYNFKQIGVTAGARYTALDVGSLGTTLTDEKITDFYAGYKFTGTLKGLELETLYTILSDGYAPSGTGDELWFKANYKF